MERDNWQRFRGETIARHKQLFKHLFCRIGGRAFDVNGEELHLDAHHVVKPYAEDHNTKGTDNGVLIGSHCHQKIIHNGSSNKTLALQQLKEQFLEDDTKSKYPLNQINCNNCGFWKK
jgi:hypothetical protein